jgi:hypothetical protein
VLSGKADSSAASAPFADGRRSLSWVRDGLGAGGGATMSFSTRRRMVAISAPSALSAEYARLLALPSCALLRRVVPDGAAVSAPSADGGRSPRRVRDAVEGGATLVSMSLRGRVRTSAFSAFSAFSACSACSADCAGGSDLGRARACV